MHLAARGERQTSTGTFVGTQAERRDRPPTTRGGRAWRSLSDEDVAQLRQIFEEQLTGDVTLVHYTQRESKIVVPGVVPCATCRDTLELLEELVELERPPHPRGARLRRRGRAGRSSSGVDKIPATIVRGKDGGERARFFGIPAGYEFTTLLEDILDVGGGGAAALERKTIDALAQLEEDVHIQVFVTPT